MGLLFWKCNGCEACRLMALGKQKQRRRVGKGNDGLEPGIQFRNGYWLKFRWAGDYLQ